MLEKEPMGDVKIGTRDAEILESENLRVIEEEQTVLPVAFSDFRTMSNVEKARALGMEGNPDLSEIMKKLENFYGKTFR